MLIKQYVMYQGTFFAILFYLKRTSCYGGLDVTVGEGEGVHIYFNIFNDRQAGMIGRIYPVSRSERRDIIY